MSGLDVERNRVLMECEGDRILRWEEYFDSFTMGPLQRIALGETRRHEQSRRQPPFIGA